MKKFFALLMSLAMVLSLAACGGGEATEEGGSGGDGGNGETKVLRLSTHLSIDHSTMQMAQKFKELLVESPAAHWMWSSIRTDSWAARLKTASL